MPLPRGEAAGVPYLTVGQPWPDSKPQAPQMGAQFAGGVRPVSMSGTPRGKLWASGLALAAAATAAEVEAQKFPRRAFSSGVLETPALSI